MVQLSKAETVSFLKKIVEVEDKLNFLECREQYLKGFLNKLDTEPYEGYHKDDSIVWGVILTCLTLGVLGFIFTTVILALFFRPAKFLYETWHISFADNHPVWTTIILGYILTCILAVPLAILGCKDQKKSDLKRLKIYNDALSQRPQIENELEQIQQTKPVLYNQILHLANMQVIHNDYIPYSKTLLQYLETSRADTLKEALNLLEYELREDERDRIQQAHNQAMQQHAAAQSAALQDIQAESGRAADAAEESALWGAAATFIAASETERQRKRDRDQNL